MLILICARLLACREVIQTSAGSGVIATSVRQNISRIVKILTLLEREMTILMKSK